MEHKTSLGYLQLKAAGAGVVEAVFSRFGGPPDADGDITEPGAFTDGQVVPMSAYNHASWGPGMLPVGKGVIRVLSDRAEFHAQLFTDTAAGMETYRTLKHLDGLAQWSYGYDVEDSEPGVYAGQRVRVLKRLRVHEVSPVLLGAGRDTMTTAVKRWADSGLSAADTENLTRIRLRAIKHRLEQDMAREALRAEVATIAAKHSHCYSEDRESAVPEASWHAARAAAVAYSAKLGIPVPRIRWFSEEDDPEHVDFTSRTPLLGKADLYRGESWLHRKLDDCDAWSIAAHECRHLAGGDEDAAQVFEVKARMDWGARA